MPKSDAPMIEIERLKQLSASSPSEPETGNQWPTGWYIIPLALAGCITIAAASAVFWGV